MIKVIVANKISEKINEFQKKYGSSRAFIADKIGISKQSLNALEKSDNPTIQSLEKIAYVLECKVEDLYDSFIERDLD